MSQVGFGVGIPAGPPVRFTVQTDTFRPVTAAAVVAGGTGYAVGDIITLPEFNRAQRRLVPLLSFKLRPSVDRRSLQSR